MLTVHGTRYTITERKGANGYVRSPFPLFSRTDLTCTVHPSAPLF